MGVFLYAGIMNFMSPLYSKKIISLDLETTDLDSRTGRIMEVGAIAVEFVFDAKAEVVTVKFGEEFSTLVNPEVQPAPQALALTGITQADLEKAPKWTAVKPKLEKFVDGAVILGHNIGFDINFLASQGLKLRVATLDTLELAQTFLPLLPVHSLEYLVSEFAISADASHRALADSKSAAWLFAQIVNAFLLLPAATRKEIAGYLDSSLSFAEFFSDLPVVTLRPSGEQTPAAPLPAADFDFSWKEGTIFFTPLGFTEQNAWIAELSQQRRKAVVALSHPSFLAGVVAAQRVASPGMALCEKRLAVFQAGENMTVAKRRILIKISVARASSNDFDDLSGLKWAADEYPLLAALVADPQVCPEHKCAYWRSLTFTEEKPLFITLSGLFSLAFEWKIKHYQGKTLLFDLARVEDTLAETLTERYGTRRLRSFFAPVFSLPEHGGADLPRQLEEFVNELDLFFGILHLVFRAHLERGSTNVMVGEAERISPTLSQLLGPLTKLLKKFAAVDAFLKLQQTSAKGEMRSEIAGFRYSLAAAVRFLEEFFQAPQEDKNYWVRVDEQGTELCAAPEELDNSWQNFAKVFTKPILVDTELPQISLNYFRKRLGLSDFAQAPLFGDHRRKPLKIFVAEKLPERAAVLKKISALSGRVVVVAPNESSLTELHEQLQESSVNQKPVLAYRISGSVGILQKRFRAVPDAVLLLTTHALLRYFPQLPPARGLVVFRLPFEAPGVRPGRSAQSGDNHFMSKVVPRAVNILHVILSRFAAAAEQEQEIYLLDPRILTDYGQAFLQYLQEFPDLEISTGRL